MSKQVRETNAGLSISAYVVMKGAKQVAKVHVHFGSSTVRVDVWDGHNDLQQGRAGGYGYDKFTAALSGLTIGGIVLNDHCGTSKATERTLKAYRKEIEGLPRDERRGHEKKWQVKAEKKGMRFANYCKVGEELQYTSLFLESGLDKLRMLGFNVIQAI
ncbi:hypothetical protein KAR91_01760 [Candidatus Pacearchaeota archaeon]|nr:hypothetical protein [Candidatus Pacearchaeota archaeon]